MEQRKGQVFGTRDNMLCVIALAAVMGFFMAGCGNAEGGPTGGHTHSYGGEWKYNETHHWQECTGGDGATSEPEAHTDAMSCTICRYERFLKFTGLQVYEWGELGEIGNPVTSVTKALPFFSNDGNFVDISSYFTGSAAVTEGKITVTLKPKESELESFNDFYKSDANICDNDVEGLIVGPFSDGDELEPLLVKEEKDVIQHRVYFVYVDRDVTFSGDTSLFKWNGISVKNGWNYISVDLDTRVCTRITETDISGYSWVNYY